MANRLTKKTVALPASGETYGLHLLRLGKIRLRAVRQRHVENVEDHGNPGVIAENSDQLDDAPVAQEALHALAHPLRVRILDELRSPASAAEVASGFCTRTGLPARSAA